MNQTDMCIFCSQIFVLWNSAYNKKGGDLLGYGSDLLGYVGDLLGYGGDLLGDGGDSLGDVGDSHGDGGDQQTPTKRNR